MTLINIAEIRAAARQALSPEAWDYIDGASEDERTMADNAAAFSDWRLVPRILRDVSIRTLETQVLGQTIALPVLLAPTSPLRLAHSDAELAQVRAAASRGTVAVCSMDAHYDLEKTAAEGGTLWFQLYCYGDRALMAEVIGRAERAGYKALVVTVDAFHPGRRERMLRNGFVMPSDIHLGNLRSVSLDPSLRRPDGSVKRFALTWQDLEWLRGCTSLPIVLKGVMAADDAEQAVDRGVAGLVVSNHGGRQIDQAPSSLSCLASIVDRVQSRAEVYLDGGVQRGTDVVKALALGARAVLIGRAYVWGLAVAGEQGVARVLDILRQEIDVAMAQLGVADLSAIDSSCLVRSRSSP